MPQRSDSRLSVLHTAAILAACLAFLAFQYLVVGLTPMHILIVVLFSALYFAHSTTRKLAIAMLPFIAFGVTYDWMRLWPNYKVNPIDIQPIYEAEKHLFGIPADGSVITPNEYFSIHHHPVADALSGFFYLCWVPLPIAFGLWLLFHGERRWYAHFALVFLFVNWLGFCGYYIHPAAPPWYAMNFGFEPDFSTPGNVGGLARFDELVGIPVFHSIYVGNANIFAAVPSLHAAYMLIATIYAILSKRHPAIIAVFAIITMGIWWTAVYSCHHYVIDVLLGIATAFVGVLLFEQVLMRIPPFRRFVERFTQLI